MIHENLQEKIKIKRLLAEQLGLEIEDISDDDSLVSDLHMRPSDLSDFTSALEANNIDTTKLDFTEIETIDELLESLTGGI